MRQRVGRARRSYNAVYSGIGTPDIWHTGILGLKEAVTEREWEMVRDGLRDSVVAFRVVSKLLRERVEKLRDIGEVLDEEGLRVRQRASVEAFALSKILKQLQGVMVSVSAVHLVGNVEGGEVEVEVG